MKTTVLSGQAHLVVVSCLLWFYRFSSDTKVRMEHLNDHFYDHHLGNVFYHTRMRRSSISTNLFFVDLQSKYVNIFYV